MCASIFAQLLSELLFRGGTMRYFCLFQNLQFSTIFSRWKLHRKCCCCCCSLFFYSATIGFASAVFVCFSLLFIFNVACLAVFIFPSFQIRVVNAFRLGLEADSFEKRSLSSMQSQYSMQKMLSTLRRQGGTSSDLEATLCEDGLRMWWCPWTGSLSFCFGFLFLNLLLTAKEWYSLEWTSWFLLALVKKTLYFWCWFRWTEGLACRCFGEFSFPLCRYGVRFSKWSHKITELDLNFGTGYKV